MPAYGADNVLLGHHSSTNFSNQPKALEITVIIPSNKNQTTKLLKFKPTRSCTNQLYMVTTIDFGKVFGKKDAEELSPQVKAYNERRFKQMAIFYGFTVMTFLSAKLAARGVVKRRYIPNYYQHNHTPPSFSLHKDALSAITHSSLLAFSTMAMAVTGTLWSFDTSNGQELGFRLKKWLGGLENEEKLSKEPIDEDSKAVQSTLSRILGGK